MGYLKLGSIKVAHKVVVKLEHLNVTVDAGMLVNRVDVILGVVSIGGKTPNVLCKTYIVR